MTSKRIDGTDGRARFDSVNGPCQCAGCQRPRTDGDALSRALRAYAEGRYDEVINIASEARTRRDGSDSEELSRVVMNAQLRAPTRTTRPATRRTNAKRKDADDDKSLYERMKRDLAVASRKR